MSTTDVLLALLRRGPAHGYDLKVSYDRWFDRGRPLAFGQVYSTLARLLRDGLVEVAHTEMGGGPERTVYELTAAGDERVVRWLQTPVEPGPAGAEEMIRKAVAAFRLDVDPAGFVARQRSTHLRRMRQLTELDAAVEASASGSADGAGSDVVAELVRDHALAHLDADLRWLELAEARLADVRPTQARAGGARLTGSPQPTSGARAVGGARRGRGPGADDPEGPPSAAPASLAGQETR